MVRCPFRLFRPFHGSFKTPRKDSWLIEAINISNTAEAPLPLDLPTRVRLRDAHPPLPSTSVRTDLNNGL